MKKEITSIEMAKEVTASLLEKYPNCKDVKEFMTCVVDNKDFVENNDLLIIWGRASRFFRGVK